MFLTKNLYIFSFDIYELFSNLYIKMGIHRKQLFTLIEFDFDFFLSLQMLKYL